MKVVGGKRPAKLAEQKGGDSPGSAAATMSMPKKAGSSGS